MSGMARAHAVIGWGFVGLVVLQFFLAGLGIFGAADFTAHVINGTVLLVLALLLVILALAGRLGGGAVAISALLLVLTGLQGALPGMRDGAAVIAALHPLNALVLLLLGFAVARGLTLATLVPARRGAPAGGSLRGR